MSWWQIFVALVGAFGEACCCLVWLKDCSFGVICEAGWLKGDSVTVISWLINSSSSKIKHNPIVWDILLEGFMGDVLYLSHLS